MNPSPSAGASRPSPADPALDPGCPGPLELQTGISVVIPVYNSASTLGQLVEQLAAVLPQDAERFEVVLVNDGSQDASWQLVRELAARYAWVRGFNLMRNYGQHNALLCGIRSARFSVTVTMDDDLQHPPTEIRKLLAELDKGFDVVYGTPAKEQHGLWRNVASQLTKLAMQSAIGVNNARYVSAFRAFRTTARQAFSDHAGPFVSLDVVLSWATSRFSHVPVEIAPRPSGKSNYTFGKLVVHALTMMTGYSTLPLRLSAVIGFTFTLFGVGMLVYVIGLFFLEGGSSVPGFPFLASIISIFSGAQLFALGIMGEYLARMHFRMMERPTYTIREVIVERVAVDARRTSDGSQVE